ncbi:MAG: Asp-tRNA(Asn)/Glu-tRNA(Gln) amidotransferase subunit GatA [Acidobacteriota bacterium]
MSAASVPSLEGLARAIADGSLQAREVVEASLDRVARFDRRLHAFHTLAAEQAMARAVELDEARAAGRPIGVLHGVPIALKDNICTRGIATTAASRILEGFVPPYSATVVERLEAAGAIVLGKTNLDEFAMGSSTENSGFGPTRNPWDLERTPGGSSGGSAVAVAAGYAPAALGSDTGGSIRQPAALTGVVGLKPTYGRVSRYGLLAFASSLDQIGPLTRTAADAAIVLAVIAGADPHDATASTQPVPPYRQALTGDVRSLRIGVPRRVLSEGVDPDVLQALDSALAVLRARGATVLEVDLPHASYGIPIYYLIATAEASSNLARYDGVRYGMRAPLDKNGTLKTMYDKTRDAGFGAEAKRRIMLGTYVLSAGYYDAYYLKAQQVRTLVRQDYEHAFDRVDVVASPTTPAPAFRLGEKTADPLQMYLADVFTVSANLAGLPAISAPCDFSADGLPIGIQLTGRPFDEETLLRAVHAFQQDTDLHERRPPHAA